MQVAEQVRPDLVRVYGPGIDKAVRNQPTYFLADTSAAGPGELSVQVVDEKRAPLQTQQSREGDVSRVSYTPRSVGQYAATVSYGPPGAGAGAGQPVQGSPFAIKVHPDVDVSKVYVEGLQPSMLLTPFFEHLPRKNKNNIHSEKINITFLLKKYK